MNITVYPDQPLFKRSFMIYGHFIEHFHRQIYGGLFDPTNPLSDEDGFRMDILEAMRRIHVPILRWPGGCFVSAYHWKKAVGEKRTPFFDKAWRVEDPATFGTDEYIKLCRKIGAEPYICTNAGTGTAEEMSDWMEYCNLESEGEFAKLRIRNGHEEPYSVRYWSIGNENYGSWEIGAKEADEWSRLVLEAAKMMKHVDPRTELSAAALPDIDWNVKLLGRGRDFLSWISIHKYWNLMAEENDFADYNETMAYTNDLETDIRKVRGLLMAFGLEKKIRIACDEWNLRGWHHPKVLSIQQGITKEEYLYPRDKNDQNEDYTMADAVFTACYLNTLNRNADIVGMACFAPIVNTRGCIFSYDQGIVLRSTYHVFNLYVNYMGDEILSSFESGGESLTVTGKAGDVQTVSAMDVLATRKADGTICIAAVNKDAENVHDLVINAGLKGLLEARVMTVNGPETTSYNDIGHTDVTLTESDWMQGEGTLQLQFMPHSVNVVQIRRCPV